MPEYDRAYFDRWYRSPRTRLFTRAEIERRVRFAVAAAELINERPLRRVLDVCCGEGHWQPIFHRLRPRARWLGVDASEYAVARFGSRRRILRGRFGQLGSLGLRGRFDLIVCAGALNNIDTAELRAGLRAIRTLLDGVALLEIFTERDDIVGHVKTMQRRSAAEYERWLREAGLAHVGMHCWVGSERGVELTEFERGR